MHHKGAEVFVIDFTLLDAAEKPQNFIQNHNVKTK